MQVSDAAIDLLRQDLDPSFHLENYSKPRIKIQNEIIRRRIKLVSRSALQMGSNQKKKLIFLAGPVGAGKSTFVPTLMNTFANQSYCLLVDMDSIRYELPESTKYKQQAPLEYGRLTQKESGCIAELLIRLGLMLGVTTIVDASMFDVDWHIEYITAMKSRFDVQVVVIHVTAEEEIIRHRITQRNGEGNRVIPNQVLEASLNKLLHISTSLVKLTPVVDLLVSVDNSADHPVILHPWYLTWQQLLETIDVSNANGGYGHSQPAYLFSGKAGHQSFSLSSATTIPVTITESSAISHDAHEYNYYDVSNTSDDTISYRKAATATAAELITQSEPCAACDVTAVRNFLYNIDNDLVSKADTRRMSREGRKDRSYRWPLTAAAQSYDVKAKEERTETQAYFSSPLERAKGYFKKEQRCLTCSLDAWPVASSCSSLTKRKGTKQL